MGKKRKASSGPKASRKSPERPSKLALTGWQDVADSEDEFLLNREKILLEEGPEAKRRRKIEEEGVWIPSSSNAKTNCRRERS
jgi:U3 small nucleolar RNA-associated protein 3